MRYSLNLDVLEPFYTTVQAFKKCSSIPYTPKQSECPKGTGDLCQSIGLVHLAPCFVRQSYTLHLRSSLKLSHRDNFLTVGFESGQSLIRQNRVGAGDLCQSIGCVHLAPCFVRQSCTLHLRSSLKMLPRSIFLTVGFESGQSLIHQNRVGTQRVPTLFWCR